MGFQIEGLPEGVEVIRFGLPGPEDFTIIKNHDGDIYYQKGSSPPTSCVAVRAINGFEFVYDPPNSCYRLDKSLDKPEAITKTFTVTVQTQRQKDEAYRFFEDVMVAAERRGLVATE
jgi:hypothetical protein